MRHYNAYIRNSTKWPGTVSVFYAAAAAATAAVTVIDGANA